MRVQRLTTRVPCHVCGATAVVRAWSTDLCAPCLEMAAAEQLGPAERGGHVPVGVIELLSEAERRLAEAGR